MKTGNRQTDFDMIQKCTEGINARISALGIKGPKRQADEALSYATGFAKALQLADFDISPLQAWISFDLCYRGMLAATEAAKASAK